MTENLPAVPQSREIARTETDGWIAVVGDVAKLADYISGTDFVPRALRNSAPATAAAILAGREAGLAPMASLAQMHVIEGKPSLSAEGMRALVLKAGHTIHVAKTTGAECAMRGRRAGAEEWTEIVWTIDMARAAGVANKQVWKSYPRQMLQARATTELCRLLFPDVILGLRSIEEFDVLDGAVVEDEDGNTAPASTGAKVTRKRAAKKTAAARPASPALAPAGSSVMDGPPLPGADDPAPVPGDLSSAGGDDDGPLGGGSGEDVEPLVDDDQDVHDAVLVEEPPLPLDAEAEPVAEVEEKPTPGPSTRAQHRMLFAALEHLGVTEDDRHAVVSTLLDREVESFNGLTKDEAGTLITTLSMFDGDRAKLLALLAEAGA